jgi:hypothetical protein
MGGGTRGVAAVLMYEAGEPMPQRGPASRIAHLTLLGTVLPNGSVQITFVPRLRGTSGAVTGFGQMVEIGGAWVFAMQMSTDRLGTRVLHWAISGIVSAAVGSTQARTPAVAP